MYVNTAMSTSSLSSSDGGWSIPDLDSEDEWLEMMPDLSTDYKRPRSELVDSCISKIKKQCKSLKTYGRSIRAAVRPKTQAAFGQLTVCSDTRSSVASPKTRGATSRITAMHKDATYMEILDGGSLTAPSEPPTPVPRNKNMQNAGRTTSLPRFIGGHLKLAIYVNHGLLTVHVLQARNLKPSSEKCSSFVKVSLLPDQRSSNDKAECDTEVVYDTNHPIFDQKLSLELHGAENKRLHISVWNRDSQNNCSEFLGAMSFGVKHLIHMKTAVKGWYCLLTEETATKKHLQVASQKQQVRPSAAREIPELNKDLAGMESMTVVIKRGRGGFGFTVLGCSPVKIGRIEEGSPAQLAGLCSNDCVVRINGQNVSRSSADSVAKIIRQADKQLVLDIQRVATSATSTPRQPLAPLGNKQQPWQPPLTSSWQQLATFGREEQKMDISSEREEEYQESSIGSCSISSASRSRKTTMSPSSPYLSPVCQHSSEHVSRQAAVQRLVQCELLFVEKMKFGIERYSRPLRHCILSPAEHATLFQNVEKVVAMSEYHLCHLEDSLENSADKENTGDCNVGKMYLPKAQMLCEAYEYYCSGIKNAIRSLVDLKEYAEFTQFLQEPSVQADQPSISNFLQKPLAHIRDLVSNLQTVLSATSQTHVDREPLQQTIEALHSSCNRINAFHTRRSPSTSSLASSDCSRSTSSGVTIASVDSEVMDIQSRLFFAEGIQTFHLPAPTRHVIYSGQLQLLEDGVPSKMWVILLSDMLLITEREEDNTLTVVAPPVLLQEVTNCGASSQNGQDFRVRVDANCHSLQLSSEPWNLVFHAPSLDQRSTWCNLLQQRISAQRSQRDLMRMDNFI